jgi:hypothetical protein
MQEHGRSWPLDPGKKRPDLDTQLLAVGWPGNGSNGKQRSAVELFMTPSLPGILGLAKGLLD